MLGGKLACPREGLALMHFFANFLPLSLDIYSIYLNSDLDSYLRALFQAYLMFLQLGKKNYVQLTAVYLAILEHWRVEQPELLATYNAAHARLSEEEIELFHATIRPYTDHKRTPEDLAEAINFHAATREEAIGWHTATGIKHYRSGLSVEHCPTAVGNMGTAVKGLLHLMINGHPSVPSATKDDEWISPVLGPISDRIFSIPLQRSPTLHGFKDISVQWAKARSTCDIAPSTHFVCGHLKEGTNVCRQCLAMTTQVTEVVIRKFQEKLLK
jgi:hypothetical protein